MSAKQWLGAAGAAVAVAVAGVVVVRGLQQQVTSLSSDLATAKAGLADAQKESAALRQEIAKGRATESDLRQRLRDSDIRGARAVEVNELREQLGKSQGRIQEVERDNTSLRQQLERSQAVVAAAATTESELRQRLRESDARLVRPVQPPAPAPVVLPPQALVQSLIRDAEAKLAQRRFEAARTIVEGVLLRVDPGNAQASALLDRIKARELQYLREETTLK